MALFASYNEPDSPHVRVGDARFVGMDYRTAPDKLPEGVYSFGENVRCRTGEVVTRPGNPYIGWYYPDNYPWDIEYSNGGVELTGTWNASSGTDSDVTVTAGTTSGTPFSDGYKYLRFGNGSGPAVVVKATGEESGGAIPVETQFVANKYDVTAEAFVWCKQLTGDENNPDALDMQRSVITNASPTQTVITTGQFRDPNSKDYSVIVTNSSTWFGGEHNRPFEVTIPDGVDDNAYLLQCFDKLLLFRGVGQEVLEYSTSVPTWSSITSSSSGGYTLALPNADRAVFFQNRVWLHVDDYLYFSDIGTYTRYYLLDNEVRINEGDNDKIVALFPFGKYAMLIFKENSIFALDNLYGDVAQNMRLRQISSRIGCGAAETITNVGNRVWFCDKTGHVWDISQVDEERMELSGQPVSWPIKPYMDTLGTRNISKWCAAYDDGYFYLFFNGQSVRLWMSGDDHYNIDEPNYVAVYDTITESWVSVDIDSNLNVAGRPIRLGYMDKERLMVVDKITGNLRVIGYGELDGTRPRVLTTSNWDGCPSVNLRTRGYMAAPSTEQSFNEVRVYMKRRDSDFFINGYVDGVNETDEYFFETTRATDRVTYLNANEYTGYAEWDPTNVNGGFDDPYRRDYSVYPGTTGINLGSQGISLGLFQNFKYIKKINELGNYMQVHVENRDGQVKIGNVSVAVRQNMNLQGERV